MALLATTKAGDATQKCTITTSNNYSYMCKNTAGVTIPTTAEKYGCVQADMTSTSTDLAIGATSYSVACEDKIECFLYASYGKTSGSCSQVSSSTETCLFADDKDSFTWMPEAIGKACIGQKTCDFTLTTKGFTSSSGTVYDQTTKGDSGFALGANNKLKIIPLCGKAGAATSVETKAKADGSVKNVAMTSATTALISFLTLNA